MNPAKFQNNSQLPQQAVPPPDFNVEAAKVAEEFEFLDEEEIEAENGSIPVDTETFAAETDESFESDLDIPVEATSIPPEQTIAQPVPVHPSRLKLGLPVPPGMTPASIQQRREQEKLYEQRRKVIKDSLLSLALEEQDEAFKNKVYEIVIQTGIDVDDPAFLMMIASGRLEKLLEESPKELSALFDQWSDLVHSQLADYQKGLEHYEQAAVKGQQKAIARAVSDLIRKTAVEKFLHSFNAVSIGLGAVVILVAAGMGGLLGAGWATWQQAQVDYSPAQPRRLTLEEANALQWAMSEDGKFARQLLEWNQDLLSRSGSSRLCEQETAQLGVTRIVGSKAAKNGFCTLWVVPPAQRQF